MFCQNTALTYLELAQCFCCFAVLGGGDSDDSRDMDYGGMWGGRDDGGWFGGDSGWFSDD